MHSRAVALVLTGWLTACANCNRDGCDALDSLAGQDGAGIAGVIAHESDVVADGCQECAFGEATIQLWQVEEPVTTEMGATEVVNGEAPTMTIAASERYRAALTPGDYLFCVRPSCVSVVVAEEETLTVNMRLIDGPAGFFVSAAGSNRLVETPGFEVGF